MLTIAPGRTIYLVVWNGLPPTQEQLFHDENQIDPSSEGEKQQGITVPRIIPVIMTKATIEPKLLNYWYFLTKLFSVTHLNLNHFSVSPWRQGSACKPSLPHPTPPIRINYFLFSVTFSQLVWGELSDVVCWDSELTTYSGLQHHQQIYWLSEIQKGKVNYCTSCG